MSDVSRIRSATVAANGSVALVGTPETAARGLALAASPRPQAAGQSEACRYSNRGAVLARTTRTAGPARSTGHDRQRLQEVHADDAPVQLVERRTLGLQHEV